MCRKCVNALMTEVRFLRDKVERLEKEIDKIRIQHEKLR